MSELVTTRIRATATKLGLPHLADALSAHLSRADAAQMGYLPALDHQGSAQGPPARIRHLLLRASPHRCRHRLFLLRRPGRAAGLLELWRSVRQAGQTVA
ncbi:hypothetical protein AB0I81_63680 [Nonomuraea sp. NPDC050404]|uniref:hypothetical protein n=1 Tax=Nonomuraea sp. NPDC050404 TaxID=3155783 RepID=UPI0033D2FA25